MKTINAVQFVIGKSGEVAHVYLSSGRGPNFEMFAVRADLDIPGTRQWSSELARFLHVPWQQTDHSAAADPSAPSDPSEQPLIASPARKLPVRLGPNQT